MEADLDCGTIVDNSGFIDLQGQPGILNDGGLRLTGIKSPTFRHMLGNSTTKEWWKFILNSTTGEQCFMQHIFELWNTLDGEQQPANSLMWL
ncbi:hypothetical protein GN956_G17112 [Arapaima gigas]